MPHQPYKPVERKICTDVYLHDLFFEISEAIGYSYDIVEDYLDDIEELVNLWTEQGFIEVYTDDQDKQYGRAKDTNSVPGSSPWYTGIYHARLLRTGEPDPLIIIVFESTTENGEETTVASLRFMLDHDDVFGIKGDRKTKFNPEAMKAIRKRIDSFIQRGHAYNATVEEQDQQP